MKKYYDGFNFYSEFRNADDNIKINLLVKIFRYMDNQDRKLALYYLLNDEKVYSKKPGFWKNIYFEDIIIFYTSVLFTIKKFIKSSADKEYYLIKLGYLIKLNKNKGETKFKAFTNKLKKELKNTYANKFKKKNQVEKIDSIQSFKNLDLKSYEDFLIKQKSRKDINFYDIPLEQLSVGSIFILGELSHEVLNINSHVLNKGEKENFIYYQASKEFYDYLRNNEKNIESEFMKINVCQLISQINNFKYVNETNSYILKNILNSLSDKRYYDSLIQISLYIENIFRNILGENIVDILNFERRNNYGLLTQKESFSALFNQISGIKNKDINKLFNEPVIKSKNIYNIEKSILYDIYALFEYPGGVQLRNTIAHMKLNESLEYKCLSLFMFYILLNLCCD